MRVAEPIATPLAADPAAERRHAAHPRVEHRQRRERRAPPPRWHAAARRRLPLAADQIGPPAMASADETGATTYSASSADAAPSSMPYQRLQRLGRADRGESGEVGSWARGGTAVARRHGLERELHRPARRARRVRAHHRAVGVAVEALPSPRRTCEQATSSAEARAQLRVGDLGGDAGKSRPSRSISRSATTQTPPAAHRLDPT